MKIYKHKPEATFFGCDVHCYASTAYNVIALMSLIAWLIYFTIGTFVVSKIQYLDRISPFIVSEGFATLLKLF